MKQAYKLLTILLFFFVCVSNGNAQTLGSNLSFGKSKLEFWGENEVFPETELS